PSIYNFLSPLYSTAALPPAGSNTTFFSDPAFDAALAEGNTAEDILIDAMPATPLFFGLNQAVWSDRVSDVKIDNRGNIILEDVVVS
ncbi:MAG: ABC transporter substrate-binding protein, partial [Rhodococcus sp. (in: high G+C Gram-positive bacteria)]